MIYVATGNGDMTHGDKFSENGSSGCVLRCDLFGMTSHGISVSSCTTHRGTQQRCVSLGYAATVDMAVQGSGGPPHGRMGESVLTPRPAVDMIC